MKRKADLRREFPETIVLQAVMVNVGDEQSPELEMIWNTKPRLPHPFWKRLYAKNIAYALTVELKCTVCGSVLDHKCHWSFYMEKLRPELQRLGYRIESKEKENVVFTLRSLP
jgi:hypothetical protein